MGYSHSVEEFQAFSNTRTPSPPSVHVTRLTVPMSCCDEAATLLIQALGGEEHASILVGGTKWWQVRSISGYVRTWDGSPSCSLWSRRIPGEWVTARKDWEEAKKRQKASKRKQASNGDSAQDAAGPLLPPSISEPGNTYDQDADDSRCILYTHGGGYYFGSIDQERLFARILLYLYANHETDIACSDSQERLKAECLVSVPSNQFVPTITR